MTELWGALAWSLFLLLSLFYHGREERRRLAEYKGLCRLLLHLKEALLQKPAPLAVLYADFQDGALEASGFLTLLKEKGLSAALASDRLSLSKEDLLSFREYAEGLGKRLYTEELAATRTLLEAATVSLSQKETALPARLKLTGTLFFSGGMLVLLLFL